MSQSQSGVPRGIGDVYCPGAGAVFCIPSCSLSHSAVQYRASGTDRNIRILGALCATSHKCFCEEDTYK